MKKSKGLKNAHTPNTKIGMGDFYGTGVKNPIGKIVDVFGNNNMSNSKMGKPPKSLA